MARVSTYLNFQGDTEAAFNFYKSVFGTEFLGDGVIHLGDMESAEGMPSVPESDKNLVMNVQLPILAGHVLMGTDVPESYGRLNQGDGVMINLEPDTRVETDKLFKALAAGGKIETEMQDMPWGGYFGSIADKFGVKWMFNCSAKE